jgi:DtxR family Mn-dependent transcriptional regulator
MSLSEPLSSNMEDYLEAIFHISAQKQAARAKDIADRVQVNKSSVTGALRSLSDKGLVNYAPYDIITLTATGKKLAVEIVRRHAALKDFFVKILLIDKIEAKKDCRPAHQFCGIYGNMPARRNRMAARFSAPLRKRRYLQPLRRLHIRVS